nr:MAG TPA: hypothetical protein [Caudoviricetes sp.]
MVLLSTSGIIIKATVRPVAQIGGSFPGEDTQNNLRGILR